MKITAATDQSHLAGATAVSLHFVTMIFVHLSPPTFQSTVWTQEHAAKPGLAARWPLLGLAVTMPCTTSI